MDCRVTLILWYVEIAQLGFFTGLPGGFDRDIIRSSRKVYLVEMLYPGHTKAGEVMHMSDFELLTVVFTVIGLLMTAYKLGRK